MRTGTLPAGSATVQLGFDVGLSGLSGAPPVYRLAIPEEMAPAPFAPSALGPAGNGATPRTLTPPTPDDWEIDIGQLVIDSKVAAGSFSNLYRGYYCGQVRVQAGHRGVVGHGE
jgi:hypothetical protein